MSFHTFLLAIGHNTSRNLMLQKQFSLHYWIVKCSIKNVQKMPIDKKTPTKQVLVAYNIDQKCINCHVLDKVGATIASLIIECVHGVYLADFRKKTQNT